MQCCLLLDNETKGFVTVTFCVIDSGNVPQNIITEFSSDFYVYRGNYIFDLGRNAFHFQHCRRRPFRFDEFRLYSESCADID